MKKKGKEKKKKREKRKRKQGKREKCKKVKKWMLIKKKIKDCQSCHFSLKQQPTTLPSTQLPPSQSVYRKP